MRNKLIAPFAIFLLILPLLACGLLRARSSYTSHLVLELDPSIPNREAAAHETVEILRGRLNSFGVISSKVDLRAAVKIVEEGQN